MNYLLQLYREALQDHKNKILLGLFLVSLLALLFFSNEKPQAVATTGDDLQLDTFIPAGFVLVPIQIQNQEALDAMIGDYAMVDLYSEVSKEAIAQKVKLIRSPKDPTQMAVLVPNEASRLIVQYGQHPYLVVVQNRPAKAEENSSESKFKNTSRLQWEDPT